MVCMDRSNGDDFIANVKPMNAFADRRNAPGAFNAQLDGRAGSSPG